MTISPLRILQARAEARAMLVRLGEIELEEALAPLEDYARESRIDSKLAVAIIRKAFELEAFLI